MDREFTDENIQTSNRYLSNNSNDYNLISQNNNNNRCKTCLKNCCYYLFILGSYSSVGGLCFYLGYHYKEVSEFY